jgi:hypothetical protein
MRFWIGGMALLLCHAAAATTGRELKELRAAAFHAYQAKDWPRFLEAQQQVVRAASVPRELYQLTCAEALAGHKAEALRALEAFADQDTVLDAAHDDDLVSLRGEPRYEKALQRIADSRVSRGATRTAAEVPRADLVVEDLARSGDDWILSSVRKRAVFKLSRGSLTELARTPWAALGMALDPATNTLWVTTAALEEEENHEKADQGRSAVLEIDATTGAVKARHDSPVPGALADLRLFGGAAYVSDGFGGGVYRVTSKGFEKPDDPQATLAYGAEGLSPHRHRRHGARRRRSLRHPERARPGSGRQAQAGPRQPDREGHLAAEGRRPSRPDPRRDPRRGALVHRAERLAGLRQGRLPAGTVSAAEAGAAPVRLNEKSDIAKAVCSRPLHRPGYRCSLLSLRRESAM